MKINLNSRREQVAKFMSNKNQQTYEHILKKYNNYILSIINKTLINYGLFGNSILDANLIMLDTIDTLFNIKNEKYLNWDFKTILGHTACFTTSKHVRKMSNLKNKINIICGNNVESSQINGQEIKNLSNADEIDFESQIKLDNLINSILNETTSFKNNQDDLQKIIIYEFQGLTNKEIGNLIGINRRTIYDRYTRWLKKHHEIIEKLVLL